MRHAIFAFILTALAWAGAAQAQETVQEKTAYLPSKESHQIFVLGDSLAGGLLSGLTRLTVGEPRLAIDGRFKEDSGLARPEFYDWNDALPKILESNAIDIAVIFLGANDTREIRSGNLRFAFGTQEWTNAYVAQVDRLASSLKQAGAAVYWVELPPMQARRYDAAIKAISILQRERARLLGIRFVDTAKHLLNRAGAYDVMGTDNTGAVRRLRDSDGVHFHKVGNNKLASLVLAAIRADIAVADVAARTQDPAVAAATDGPVFGQVPAEGAANTVQTDLPDLPPPQIVEPSGPDARPATERTATGSAAERLFKLGEAPPPVAGRFDDFAYSD